MKRFNIRTLCFPRVGITIHNLLPSCLNYDYLPQQHLELTQKASNQTPSNQPADLAHRSPVRTHRTPTEHLRLTHQLQAGFKYFQGKVHVLWNEVFKEGIDGLHFNLEA